MTTQEIPREKWLSFFSGFTRTHRGAAVSLESQQPRLGTLVEVESAPLEEVHAERAAGHEQIAIVLGRPEQAHQVHVVDDPRRVLLVDEAGRDRQLAIEAADGRRTLLRFVPRPVPSS